MNGNYIKPFISDNVSCSLYLGRNAGERIKNYIRNAKKSIKIFSPYFSAELIDLLLEKTESVKDIKLISSFKISDLYNPMNFNLLRKIILQKRYVDEDSVNKRKSMYYFTMVMAIILVIYIIISAVLFSTKDINLFTSTPSIYFLLLIIILFLRKKITSTRIYTYTYYTPFFVKFINNDGIFLHYKLFIIDDSYAFLGSLNFTSSGFFKNYESCITISDENIVKLLSEYFEYIANSQINEIDISSLGRKLYKEPIN
ncbi:phospholipase D/Transphosphatidylase [Thermoanaerobacter mathranii subsp. mathranii str. A3]|uniref:Phospholipase D/Transphosphatidylase n=1 Tax=Thermoanaerobacter mathranii subsp. mathranii (strain DSM 11426 / CCUG 53645 / CIP 108742 / A3) TaxID=583358 RepID=A0ABM5LM93_THEM3|nr:phospholipase D-like domain-containing protein [Thermoanaerobacter mathranii]ADH59836.1 phospholipase D/Transphosphatidylase [Thermoanaerobacter mathranii subsp. mathranii str. A3]